MNSRIPLGLGMQGGGESNKSALEHVLELLKGKNQKPVVIGLGLCFLAAFSGSNTIIYYASGVFAELGIANDNLLVYAVALPNIIGALLALYLTDRWGRRPLLLSSFAAMAASLTVLAVATMPEQQSSDTVNAICADIDTVVARDMKVTGLASTPYQTFYARESYLEDICFDLENTYEQFLEAPSPSATPDSNGKPTVPLPGLGPVSLPTAAALTCIPVYVCAFSAGAGPIPWLLYNEIFPTRVRARATAICTACNYGANVVVGTTFLSALEQFGLSGTYAIYAIICALGFYFTDKFVIETKGLSLQEVEMIMAKGTTKASNESKAKEVDSAKPNTVTPVVEAKHLHHVVMESPSRSRRE